jgi:hypothetical protein
MTSGGVGPNHLAVGNVVPLETIGTAPPLDTIEIARAIVAPNHLHARKGRRQIPVEDMLDLTLKEATCAAGRRNRPRNKTTLVRMSARAGPGGALDLMRIIRSRRQIIGTGIRLRNPMRSLTWMIWESLEVIRGMDRADVTLKSWSLIIYESKAKIRQGFILSKTMLKMCKNHQDDNTVMPRARPWPT